MKTGNRKFICIEKCFLIFFIFIYASAKSASTIREKCNDRTSVKFSIPFTGLENSENNRGKVSHACHLVISLFISILRVHAYSDKIH